MFDEESPLTEADLAYFDRIAEHPGHYKEKDLEDVRPGQLALFPLPDPPTS